MILLMIIALFVMSFIDFSAPVFLGPEGQRINLVFLIVCIFFALASYTDYLDGHIARTRGLVTDLGKFLDPVADKLLINTLCIFLAVPALFSRYAPEQVITFNAWCVMLLVARDIVVDALRFIAAQKNVVIAANIFGKCKTVLEMIAIILVLLNGWPFSYFDHTWPNGLRIVDFVVYITTLVSIISGVIYVVQNRKVFKEEK